MIYQDYFRTKSYRVKTNKAYPEITNKRKVKEIKIKIGLIKKKPEDMDCNGRQSLKCKMLHGSL